MRERERCVREREEESGAHCACFRRLGLLLAASGTEEQMRTE